MQTPCRQAIVEALDDLGERDTLTYEQRTAAEMPYPPSVVDERRVALRRRRWGAWGALGLSALVVTVVYLSNGFDWAITEVATAFLIATVPLVAHGTRALVHCGKAEQLYTLLRRVDETAAADQVPAVA
jgi:hypothetical protein